MIPVLPALDGLKSLVVAALAALIFGAGWAINGWRLHGQIAEIESRHTREAAQQAAAALDRLQAAQARGDRLSRQVALAETARTLATQEKTDALRRLTAGRRCLDADAVRMLNDATGLKPRGVSDTAWRPVGADAAFATDTDVGLWIGEARRAYDTCRGRLAAIADFYVPTEDHE